MEASLKQFKVRIFKDIHVSGHASREDHRDLIKLVRPKNIIPTHGDLVRKSAMADLAKEMGYEKVHILENGDKISI